jgi:hypothetical protein
MRLAARIAAILAISILLLPLAGSGALGNGEHAAPVWEMLSDVRTAVAALRRAPFGESPHSLITGRSARGVDSSGRYSVEEDMEIPYLRSRKPLNAR